MANAAVASHCRACGKVASDLLDANDNPTSAETDRTTPVELLNTAWHMASSATLRFILGRACGSGIKAPV